MTENEIQEKARKITASLTLEEKASFCSGKDFWHLKSLPEKGLPEIRVNDGPFGLRIPFVSENGFENGSIPATCFPTSAATASSFDVSLMGEIGKALGEECREEGVSVILGPGINIKRNPLGGRNFEYISEDPCLAGKMACAYIDGVQGEGVGTSLKHYSCNSQETGRFVRESVVDDRALREIYLPAFEEAVKKSQPWTIMASYNKIYGKHSTESAKMLTQILRREWGFQGLVVSDWGAVCDRVEGVRAGCDLEMPCTGTENDEKVKRAVRDGTLSEEELDACVSRVAALILRAQDRKPFRYDRKAHHELARKAAAGSAVLLKNEDSILPGHPGQSAAVIGAMAKEMRYQGAGSSHVVPNLLDSPYDEFIRHGVSAVYEPGYDLTKEEPDEELIRKAVEAAKGKEIVYLFAGLPASYEAEGIDRKKIAMPPCMTELIKAVSEVNRSLVVILFGGSAIDVSWRNQAKAILAAYLPGEAGGEAVVDLLLGKENPSGSLAETWPEKLSDVPSCKYFPGYPKSVEYRESIFVGYRYYDTAEVAPAYPFGHGLSYTSFVCQDLETDKDTLSRGGNLTVSLIVKNTGERAGAKAVQLYLAKKDSAVFRAKQELKGFEKVFLLPGEEKKVQFILTPRDFSFWNVKTGGWFVEAGDYEIRIGTSSRDICLTHAVHAEGDSGEMPDYRKDAPCYYTLAEKHMNVSVPEFYAVLGRKLAKRNRKAGDLYTMDSTVGDVKTRKLGQAVIGIGMKVALRRLQKSGDMIGLSDEFENMPLRFFCQMEGRMLPQWKMEAFVEMMNSHYVKGFRKLAGKGGKKDGQN
jgi:beta-glucosidase